MAVRPGNILRYNNFHSRSSILYPRCSSMAAGDLVLAMTGASGAPYGVRLLEVLLRAGRTVHFAISPAGAEVLKQEMNRVLRLDSFQLEDLLRESAANTSERFHYHDYRDFNA